MMGWTGPSDHDGWAAVVTADGCTASTHTGGGVIVDRDADGTSLPFSIASGPSNPNFRPDSSVIGWMGECECGWRGPRWDRVETPEQADPERRRVHNGTDSYLGDPESTGIEQEWREHVAPYLARDRLREAAERAKEANEALDAAVRDARALGVSWLYVGLETGRSRQAAHERWRRVDPPDARTMARIVD